MLVSDYPPVRDIQVVEEKDKFDLGSGVSLEVVTLPGHTLGGIGLFEAKTKTFFAGDAVCNYNKEFEFYMPPSFPELFDYNNYLKSLDKMLEIDFEYLCMGHFGTQKQPKHCARIYACACYVYQNVNIVHTIYVTKVMLFKWKNHP